MELQAKCHRVTGKYIISEFWREHEVNIRCWQILVHVRVDSFSLLLCDASSGSQERQDKLREMGFVDILHKLTQASDPNLSDR